MQIQSGPPETHKYRSCLHSIMSIYKEFGFKGVMRGLNATLVRDAIGYGFFFMCYEIMREW